MVYNIARVDNLVFGMHIDDRGKCGFRRHDGVIDECVCVFFSPYSQYEHALQQPYLLPSTKNCGVTCTLDNFAI